MTEVFTAFLGSGPFLIYPRWPYPGEASERIPFFPPALPPCHTTLFPAHVYLLRSPWTINELIPYAEWLRGNEVCLGPGPSYESRRGLSPGHARQAHRTRDGQHISSRGIAAN